MMDSWSNESLMCYAIKAQSVPLVNGTYQYTIGAGGDINDTRPIRVIIGPGAAFLTDENGNRYPVDVVPQDKWNEVWNLTNSFSNLPDTMFYDPQYPLGIINVTPVPNGPNNVTLTWNSYLQLTGFAGLTTDVILPPGYEKLIVDNLAVAIWRYFKSDNSQIPPDLFRDAGRSMGNVKRSNMRENIAEFDKVMTQPWAAVWNPYSDNFR